MKNLLRKKKQNKSTSDDNKAEQEEEQLIEDSDYEDNDSPIVMKGKDTSAQQLSNFASHDSWEKIETKTASFNVKYKKDGVNKEKPTSKGRIKTDKPRSKNKRHSKTPSVNSDTSIDNEGFQDSKLKETPREVKQTMTSQDGKLKSTPQDVKLKSTPQDVILKITPQDVMLKTSKDIKTTAGNEEVVTKKLTLLELSRQCTYINDTDVFDIL